jgi:oligoribonuclease NrnB/cAMP/cGMP phosphodiesterase (DHH superfamily)
MLTEEQLEEIREHLKKAHNPLFFFDNDNDGLASFLLLRRAIGSGKGVAIKSFPDMNSSYFRKVEELNPDYVFILDKPLVSEEFLKKTFEMNIPVVWIDHHETIDHFENFSNVSYYNPIKNNEKSTNEPVTYWCYQVVKNKKDIWIAITGCIGDGYLPEFYEEFLKDYSEFGKKIKTAFEGLYETEIGKITQMINFGLKDRTSNVVKMLRYLIDIKSPNELLEENNKNKTIIQRYEFIQGRCKKLVEKAIEVGINKNSKEMVFFQYGGDLSLSADIANEIFHKFPDKLVVVAYLKGTRANISVRWKKDAKKITEKAIEGLENATGGGHKNATGAQVQIEDLPRFRESLIKYIREFE